MVLAEQHNGGGALKGAADQPPVLRRHRGRACAALDAVVCCGVPAVGSPAGSGVGADATNTNAVVVAAAATAAHGVGGLRSKGEKSVGESRT